MNQSVRLSLGVPANAVYTDCPATDGHGSGPSVDRVGFKLNQIKFGHEFQDFCRPIMAVKWW